MTVNAPVPFRCTPIKAEGQSLQTVTKPLACVDAVSPSPEGAGAR